MRFVVLLFWLSFLPKLSASALHIEGKIFRDANGNHSILRGINVTGAAKIPPFRGISGPEVLAPLRAWGFNSIRLLFNWEAFEPSPGSYDLNYLKYYRDMIDWAGQSDLYVIADIHQDAYSRASIDGCGEGFPIWTLPPETKAAEPDNGSKCVNWAIRAALDWSMHRDWHHFYQNSYGARDHYLDMLERLAEAIASAPNLVGFDLLNEPWGRDEELMQLYTDATERVRRHIPDALVFLSSHALTSTGIIPSRLPKPNFDQAVFATHYYDVGLTLTKSWSHLSLENSAQIWKKTQDQWQTPVFIGEFGVTPTLPNPADYISAIYDVLDRELYSSAQWVYTPSWDPVLKDGWNLEDFSITDEKGQLRGTYRPRPFVEKAPGTLLSMHWDEDSKSLTVQYKPHQHGEELQVLIPGRLKWTGVEAVESSPHCQSLPARRIACRLKQDASPIELKFLFE